MKKLISIVVCLLLVTVVYCQKDFNYTITTTKFKDTILTGSLLRTFKKENNQLQIINLINTGDSETYTLKYLGFTWDSDNTIWYLYTGTLNNIITCEFKICPTIPIVEVVSDMFTIKYY